MPEYIPVLPLVFIYMLQRHLHKLVFRHMTSLLIASPASPAYFSMIASTFHRQARKISTMHLIHHTERPRLCVTRWARRCTNTSLVCFSALCILPTTGLSAGCVKFRHINVTCKTQSLTSIHSFPNESHCIEQLRIFNYKFSRKHKFDPQIQPNITNNFGEYLTKHAHRTV